MKNLTIEITDECPMYCFHCSTYAGYDREGILMKKDDFIRALEENPSFKEIRLSGGEPFVHPEIMEFIKEARKRQRIVRILSCGVYQNYNRCEDLPIPEEIIKECSESVHSINFSLHGSKRTHKKVVQRSNSNVFQCLDETINRVINAKIPFSFGFVPLRLNHKDLEGAVKYASKKAREQDYCTPKLYLLRFVKQGGAQYPDVKNINERLALSREENQKVIEQAKILEDEYKIPIIPTCSMLEKGCTAGREKRVISVYGEVYHCSALKWMEYFPWDLPPIPKKGVIACKSRH